MYYRRKNWSHSTGQQVARSLAPIDASDMSRIEAIEKDARYDTLNEKDRSFVTSVKVQAASRGLSEAQRSWLSRIEKQLVPIDSSWWKPEEDDNAKKREYTIIHYRNTGYYPNEVFNLTYNPSYMPQKSKWDSMWENKFINAGYKRWIAGSKHSAGDMVLAKLHGTHYTSIISDVKWGRLNKWIYTVTFLDIPTDSYYAGYSNKEWDVTEEETKFLTRKKKKA